MKNEELYLIVAGSTRLSGTFLNSISKLINTLLDLGRTIGTSIRYIVSNKSC